MFVVKLDVVAFTVFMSVLGALPCCIKTFTLEPAATVPSVQPKVTSSPDALPVPPVGCDGLLPLTSVTEPTSAQGLQPTSLAMATLNL